MSNMVKKCIATGCFVFNKSRILLVCHKALGGIWIQPGGHVDANEIPTDAALREVKEETGIDVKLIGDTGIKSKSKRYLPKPILVTYTRVPYKDRPAHYHFNMLYLAEMTNPKQRIRTSDENAKTGWFTEKEVDGLKMFVNVRTSIHAGFKAMRALHRLG